MLLLDLLGASGGLAIFHGRLTILLPQHPLVIVMHASASLSLGQLHALRLPRRLG